MERKKVSYLVVGAGQRGAVYAQHAKKHPDEAEIAAVCEPVDNLRNRFAKEYQIPAERCFKRWDEAAALPRMADAAMICTQDAMHRDAAIAFAKKGYHLLLEKPMAPAPEDCKDILNAAEENGVMLAVCHVLRYTLFNRKVKEIIDSGKLGKIRTIQLLEPVGYWHQAHSFVRGNWRNEAESSPMLLAKSCHDLDLINYFMPSKCKRVSSFGSLGYFRPENQPKGAADRCTDCPAEVEALCAYSALKIYLRERRYSLAGWPVSVLTGEGTAEAVLNALKTGPYGRCVFACDNDVVDHQVVNMEFEYGATASFTMTAFNEGGGRELYVMGDQGSVRQFGETIEHYDFLTGQKSIVPFNVGDGMHSGGHGGGDSGIMDSFNLAVKNNDPSLISSGPRVSLESHLMVFAAEKARKLGTVEEL